MRRRNAAVEGKGVKREAKGNKEGAANQNLPITQPRPSVCRAGKSGHVFHQNLTEQGPRVTQSMASYTSDGDAGSSIPR